MSDFPRLHPRTPALAVLPRLMSLDAAIVERYTALYLESHDPEVGHQMRVALRRLRALLWAYQSLLPAGLATQWRKQLGELAGQVANARNWEVIIGEFLRAAVPPTYPAALVLLEILDDLTHRARVESRTAFTVPSQGDLIPGIRAAAGILAGGKLEGTTVIGDLARARVKVVSIRLGRRLKRARKGKLNDVQRVRHEIRRLRYLIEYFAPVLRRADRERAVHLAEAQEVLRELNDILVGAAYVSTLPKRADCAGAHALLMRWMKKERRVRGRKAVRALRALGYQEH